MVWRVSSDKWKAPSDSDTTINFFFFPLYHFLNYGPWVVLQFRKKNETVS